MFINLLKFSKVKQINKQIHIIGACLLSESSKKHIFTSSSANPYFCYSVMNGQARKWNCREDASWIIHVFAMANNYKRIGKIYEL